MIKYINNNNNNINNNIEWLGDEMCDDGMRVILSNGVEIYVYENGEMDFYDFEKSCNGDDDKEIKGDDVRYEESLNWILEKRDTIDWQFEDCDW